MTETLQPVMHVTFSVIAYDCSGYGDDRSRDFSNGEAAANYARSLEARFNPILMKRITMEPINIKIDF